MAIYIYIHVYFRAPPVDKLSVILSGKKVCLLGMVYICSGLDKGQHHHRSVVTAFRTMVDR